jgi:hypothetical protein
MMRFDATRSDALPRYWVHLRRISAAFTTIGIAVCTWDATIAEPLPCTPGAAQCLNITPNATPPSDYRPQSWHLVRTPNPRGGPDAVSVTHVADFSRSDPDLAGLTLRCADGGVESLIILITPLPPHAHPNVRIAAAESDLLLKADMVQPFTSVRLTPKATALLTGSWQMRAELDVRVENEGTKIEGVILLAGLPAALQSLLVECKSREPAGTDAKFPPE